MKIDQLQANKRGGIVYQRVDAAELVERPPHHCVRDAGFAQIAGERHNPLVGALLQLARPLHQTVLLNVAGDDIGAFLGQPPCNHQPQALRRTGDDRDPPLVAAAMRRLHKGQRRERRLRHQALLPILWAYRAQPRQRCNENRCSFRRRLLSDLTATEEQAPTLQSDTKSGDRRLGAMAVVDSINGPCWSLSRQRPSAGSQRFSGART